MIGVAALLLACSLSAQDRTSIELVARMAGSGTPADVPAVTLTSTDGTTVEEVALHAARGTVSRPAGSAWEVASASSNYWIAPTRITFPASGASTIPLEVWPTAVVTGTTTLAPSATPPALTLMVDSGPDGTAPSIARGTTFPCTWPERGTFACTIPVAKLNLVLRAPGMTPHYLWDVFVSAGATKQLGRFVFKPGASFSGRLEKSLLARLTKPARARLIRPVADVPSANAARLSVPVAEADFDRRGFVQLAPLPAGTYHLEVRAEGFATNTIGPIEIYDGKETAFRKLIELFPPAKLTVLLDPKTDVDGQAWRVRFRPLAAMAKPAGPSVVVHADANGEAVLADQSPGLFNVQVLDAAGNQLRDRDVELLTDDAFVPIHLDLHAVKGTVTLGKEPLVGASIWFGSSHGAVQVRLTADEEGRFRGRLPRTGKWPVEVRSDSPPARAVVEVVVDDGDEIAIRLADTSISGWVVDEDGQRVSSASVAVLAGRHGFETKAGDNGEFTLRGIPEGLVDLIARDLRNGGSSATLPLQVQSARPLRDVELRIQPRRRFSGRVTSAGHAIAGAGVTLSPRGGSVQRAVSDGNGAFELSVAASVTRALIIVGAPGRTLETFETAITDQPQTFDIAPAGGMLEIRSKVLGNPPFTLTRNGVPLPIEALFDWIVAHGQPLDDPTRLRVPALAPGQYRLCVRSGQCVEDQLASGGTITLAVPE
jgi:hypothetical protein